jgi:hypothetical protein
MAGRSRRTLTSDGILSFAPTNSPMMTKGRSDSFATLVGAVCCAYRILNPNLSMAQTSNSAGRQDATCFRDSARDWRVTVTVPHCSMSYTIPAVANAAAPRMHGENHAKARLARHHLGVRLRRFFERQRTSVSFVIIACWTGFESAPRRSLRLIQGIRITPWTLTASTHWYRPVACVSVFREDRPAVKIEPIIQRNCPTT